MLSFKRVLYLLFDSYLIFRNEISSNIVVQDHSERQYEAYVSVVDVGPKPISCLKKHKKRNENVINSFVAYHCASSAKENKIC